MILSRFKLKELFSSGQWKSNTPLDELKIGPNSIDVTLNNIIYLPNTYINSVDPTIPNNNLFNKLDINDPMDLVKYDRGNISGEFWINPDEFILASVRESFECSAPVEFTRYLKSNYEGNEIVKKIKRSPKYFIPMYEGRSTLARLGLQSHISAGFGDYGFKGSFTLEIKNNSPWKIKLFSGMRIGQVYFSEVDDGVVETEGYIGYDQTDTLPQLPRLGEGRF